MLFVLNGVMLFSVYDLVIIIILVNVSNEYFSY